MKQNKNREDFRSSDFGLISLALRQEEKNPRERSDMSQEDKNRSATIRERTPPTGGQNTPTAAPGKSDSTERERRSSRSSYGGYQGL